MAAICSDRMCMKLGRVAWVFLHVACLALCEEEQPFCCTENMTGVISVLALAPQIFGTNPNLTVHELYNISKLQYLQLCKRTNNSNTNALKMNDHTYKRYS